MTSLLNPLVLIVISVFIFVGAVQAEQLEQHTQSARKIVSVGGSVTEIIFALGGQKKVIARDTTSQFPETVLSLPDIGYMRALSPEGVLSLNPDALFILEGSGPAETLEVLEKANIPLLMIPDKLSAQGVIEKIDLIGRALGKQTAAQTLSTKIKRQMENLLPKLAQQKHKKKVLFILGLQGGRIMAAGQNTSAAKMIEMAGALPAITHIDGYKNISDESVLTAQPDVILMMSSRGSHQGKDQELWAHPVLATTPAGLNRRLIRMKGDYLLGFGPRIAQAVQELSDKIYGKRQGLDYRVKEDD